LIITLGVSDNIVTTRKLLKDTLSVSCSSGSAVDTFGARDPTEKVEEHESRVDKAQLTQMIFLLNGIIFVDVRGVDFGGVSEDAAASAVGSHFGCGTPCAAWWALAGW
jgi:hypothetical protein